MKKKVMITALALALSMSYANATNVTGAERSGNTYTIKPDKINANIGYKKSTDFTVSKSDVLNMDFRGKVKQGGKMVDKNIGTFINLVDNKVQIDGVLNTVRDSKFYAGHAIFITPKGFAVGESGVLNVGQLHVATPSSSDYSKLTKNFGSAASLEAINKVGNIKKDSNADIVVNGKIFARDGVDLRGKSVTVNGDILNGVNYNELVDANTNAAALFNNLVNTSNLTTSNDILIKAQKTGGISTGANSRIVNRAENGNVYLTNDGSKGIAVNGEVKAADLVRLYNKSGDLIADEYADLAAATVEVSNKGNHLKMAENSKVTATNAYITQAGKGDLEARALVKADNNIAVNNRTGSSMTVGGRLEAENTVAMNNYKGNMLLDGYAASEQDNIAILNREGSGLTLSENAEVKGNNIVKLYNAGENGLTVNGIVKNNSEGEDSNLYVVNTKGEMAFGADSQLLLTKGDLYLVSKENSTGISQAAGAKVANSKGNIVVRNASGANGMTLNGEIVNYDGTTAINNYAGDMNVAGKVTMEKGNLGMINRADAGKYTIDKDAKITLKEGEANIKQYANADFTVNGEFENSGRVNVVANDGQFTLGSKVNNEDGLFYAVSRFDGTGLDVTKDFDAQGGEVILKNYNGEKGFNFEGKVSTKDQATLINKTGEMKVNGKVEAEENRVIVKNGGEGLEFGRYADITSEQKGTILNYGTAKITKDSRANIENMEEIDKAN